MTPSREDLRAECGLSQWLGRRVGGKLIAEWAGRMRHAIAEWELLMRRAAECMCMAIMMLEVCALTGCEGGDTKPAPEPGEPECLDGDKAEPRLAVVRPYQCRAIGQVSPRASGGLSVSLEHVVLHARSEHVLVDFVMHNTGEGVIRLWELSNSWGAVTWQFEIRNAEGDIFRYGTRVNVYLGNAPTTLAIRPGGSARARCVLLLRPVDLPDDLAEREAFIPVAADEARAAQWGDFLLSGPFEIRGIYHNDQKISGLWGEGEKPTWVGKISSDWVPLGG